MTIISRARAYWSRNTGLAIFAFSDPSTMFKRCYDPYRSLCMRALAILISFVVGFSSIEARSESWCKSMCQPMEDTKAKLAELNIALVAQSPAHLQYSSF